MGLTFLQFCRSGYLQSTCVSATTFKTFILWKKHTNMVAERIMRVCSWFYHWYLWYTIIVQVSTNGTIGNTIGTNDAIGKDSW